MPFIDSKISCKITKEQEERVKEKLGEIISVIPGKSESWLMVGFEDEYTLYFKGKKPEKAAFVEVKLYGKSDKNAYNKLTTLICDVFQDEIGIPASNIYVKYEEVSVWGYNGNNF